MINFLINRELTHPIEDLISFMFGDIFFQIEPITFELMLSPTEKEKFFDVVRSKGESYVNIIQKMNKSIYDFAKPGLKIANKFQIKFKLFENDKILYLSKKDNIPKESKQSFEDYCKFLFCGYSEKKHIRNSIFFNFSVISYWAKRFNLKEIEVLQTIDHLSQINDKFFLFYYFYVDKGNQKDWENLIGKHEAAFDFDPLPIGRARYTFRNNEIKLIYDNFLINEISEYFSKAKGIALDKNLKLTNSPVCDQNKIIETLSTISTKEIKLAFPNYSRSDINKTLTYLKREIKDKFWDNNIKNTNFQSVLNNSEITLNNTELFWKLHNKLQKNQNLNIITKAEFFHFFNYLTNNEKRNIKNTYKPNFNTIKKNIKNFLDFIESNDALNLWDPQWVLELNKGSSLDTRKTYREKINDDIYNSFRNINTIKKEILAIIAFYKKYDAKQLFREFGYYDDSFRLFDILLFFMLRPEIKKLYDSQLGCYIFILIYNEIKKILE